MQVYGNVYQFNGSHVYGNVYEAVAALVVPENGAWYMRAMLPVLLEEDTIAGMDLFVAPPGVLCASTEIAPKYESRSEIAPKYESRSEIAPKYESRSEIESCN